MSSVDVSIVDDDEAVRVALEGFIRSLGYTADSYSAAEDFLSAAAFRSCNCLILDVQMPDISGLELQDRLRQQGIELPIIFITAFPDSAQREKALAAGALAFLSKPFDISMMVSLLEGVLSRA